MSTVDVSRVPFRRRGQGGKQILELHRTRVVFPHKRDFIAAQTSTVASQEHLRLCLALPTLQVRGATILHHETFNLTRDSQERTVAVPHVEGDCFLRFQLGDAGPEKGS